MQGLMREVLPEVYQTFGEYVNTRYGPIVLPDYSPRWRETATGHLETLVAALGEVPLAQLSLDHLESWWASVKATKGPRTANMLLIRLRHILAHAQARRRLQRNDASLLKPVRENGSRLTWLSDSQFDGLVRAASPGIRFYILAARYTAARLGELMRLQEQDLDLTQGLLTLNRTKVGDRHTIPLVKPLAAMLEPRLTGDPTHYVLPQYTLRESITTGFRRACQRQTPPLTNFHFHDLRHDAAVWLLRVSGGNLRLVQQVLGHKQINTTQRYAFALQDEVRAAMEAMARPVSPIPIAVSFRAKALR
jgi:integrase